MDDMGMIEERNFDQNRQVVYHYNVVVFNTCRERNMKVTSYYPVIASEHGASLVDFLTTKFGFEPIYQSSWYWHLSLKDQPDINIAVVDCQHQSIPENYRRPAQGVLINIELDDVTTYYLKCREKNVNIILDLKDEDWGQRHFIATTPEPGLLFDIIQVIPPSAEYAAHYNENTIA